MRKVVWECGPGNEAGVGNLASPAHFAKNKVVKYTAYTLLQHAVQTKQIAENCDLVQITPSGLVLPSLILVTSFPWKHLVFEDILPLEVCEVITTGVFGRLPSLALK